MDKKNPPTIDDWRDMADAFASVAVQPGTTEMVQQRLQQEELRAGRMLARAGRAGEELAGLPPELLAGINITGSPEESKRRHPTGLGIGQFPRGEWHPYADPRGPGNWPALMIWQAAMRLLLQDHPDGFQPTMLEASRAVDMVGAAAASNDPEGWMRNLATAYAQACRLIAAEPSIDDDQGAAGNEQATNTAGFTLSELAAKMKRSPSTIRNAADVAGIKRPGRGQHGIKYTPQKILAIAKERRRVAGHRNQWKAELNGWNEVLRELGHEEGIAAQLRAQRKLK